MGDVGREGQLQDGHGDAVRSFGHDELVVPVLLDGLECSSVRVGQGIGKALALGTQRVVREHADDVRQVACEGGTNAE